MRIKSVRIENFRSFKDEIIPFNNYNCLVGTNGAGKSNILMALNLFFQQSENVTTNLRKLSKEDFHQKNTATPIRITVTFCDLSNEAKEELGHYVRQGCLIVSAEATFDETTEEAEVKQYGQRLGIAEFKPFFEALNSGEKVGELRKLYQKFQSVYPELPNSKTKDSMEKELKKFESERPNECMLIRSQDEFYGISRGKNRIEKHLQWVYIPAVKDAVDEEVETKSSALGELLQRTVRTKTNFEAKIVELRKKTQGLYNELLQHQQNELNDLSSVLQQRIKKWAHPEASLRLEWKEDPHRSVQVLPPLAHVIASEGNFKGSLARFGHGFQRSYLLALLQELAITDDSTAPTLVLACEEPELHQHPPQARHLAEVLTTLSQGNAQVIVTTHNPRFVSGQGFEDVRKTFKDVSQKCTKVSHLSFKQIAKGVSEATEQPFLKPDGIQAKIHQALQPALNEMFFADRLILVEGLEDIAFLESYLQLLRKDEDFRQLGGHIVPTNGKSQMLQPLVIAKYLGIPTFVVFDADADKPDKSGSRKKHELDNKALLTLLGQPGLSPLPTDSCFYTGFTMWHSDIGSIVETDIGCEAWKRYQSKADEHYGFARNMNKNGLHIGATLAFAWEENCRSSHLVQVCQMILDPENRVPALTSLNK